MLSITLLCDDNTFKEAGGVSSVWGKGEEIVHVCGKTIRPIKWASAF